MKYEELTHKIIGCAMEVHKHLGNGFQEVIYQRALAHEMDINNIYYDITVRTIFERKIEKPNKLYICSHYTQI